MLTNPETLYTDLENSELLKTREELASLKKEIIEWVEPSITKGPERLSNGKILFDYKEKNGQKWEIITEKSWDSYKIRVKKWVKLPTWQMGRQTQKNWNNETFNFTATDKTLFNNGLSNVLNKTIGTNRDKLPKTGWKVYDMLNTESDIKTEQKESKETNKMPKWLVLDHWVYVYTVQSWDCESKIKSKLAKYAPLSYLKDVSNGIWWFNFSSIPDNKLLPWLKIPVPKPDSERIKTVTEFKKEQRLAIKEMKNNSVYWDKIKDLFKSKKEWWYWYSEDDIASAMTAYAKSETCPEDYDDKVWKLSLFRYERTHRCPSYWYYHVLYEWVGLTAFSKARISIGQACNPKDSWKLFLAFCIEKNPKNYHKFFDITNNLNWCCENYNGSTWKSTNPKYDTKLKKNYKKAKEG